MVIMMMMMVFVRLHELEQHSPRNEFVKLCICSECFCIAHELRNVIGLYVHMSTVLTAVYVAKA